MNNYDKIIIGAGLYGLYSALVCGEKGQKVFEKFGIKYELCEIILCEVNDNLKN